MTATAPPLLGPLRQPLGLPLQPITVLAIHVVELLVVRNLTLRQNLIGSFVRGRTQTATRVPEVKQSRQTQRQLRLLQQSAAKHQELYISFHLEQRNLLEVIPTLLFM